MGLADVLGQFSGAGSLDVSEKLLFNNVIGFRGVVDGVGCSTIVHALAHAFSDRTRKRVCVVDTHILYPAMYGLLCKPFDADTKALMKDWFSVEASIPERIIDTKYKHISLLGCFNRRITDAFSTTDSLKLVDDTFDVLKDLFDVILVDLSHEFTQLSACSAIKCNRIFTVVDPSATCLNNLTQSLNNFAISAVPFGKFNKVIVNKYTDRGYLGIDEVLAKNKLQVVGKIPYSRDMFEQNARNNSCWGLASMDYAVDECNRVIDNLLCSIVNETPLEIIDMKEVEALEEAIRNSDIKNKAKARKVEMRKREALLKERTAEEMEAAKQNRHTQADVLEGKRKAKADRIAAAQADQERVAQRVANLGEDANKKGKIQLNKDALYAETDIFAEDNAVEESPAPQKQGLFGGLFKKETPQNDDAELSQMGIETLEDTTHRWDTTE